MKCRTISDCAAGLHRSLFQLEDEAKLDETTFLSDSQSRMFLQMSRQRVYEHLTCLFGEEFTYDDDAAASGLFGQRLGRGWNWTADPSVGSEVSRFARAALLFFLDRQSIHADVPPIEDAPQPDFFTKGRRWSHDELRRRFYFFFNMLKRVVNPHYAPNAYWAAYARYEKLFVRLGNEAAGWEVDSRILTLPYFNNVEHEEFRTCGADCALAKWIAQILWLKRETTQIHFNENLAQQEQLRTMFEAVIRHVHDERNHATLIASISRAMGQAVDLTKGIRGHTEDDVALRLFCLYHFYDAPFQIAIYTPRIARTSDMPRFPCITITTESSDSIIAALQSCAEDITTWLGYCTRLVYLEQKVQERLAATETLRSSLSTDYQAQMQEYEQLRELIGNTLAVMIFTDTRLRGISFIENRVKTWKSFLARLAMQTYGLGTIDKGNPSMREELKAYETLRERNPPEAQVCLGKNILAKFFHDICGVRIVCLFQGDLERVSSKLSGLPIWTDCQKKYDPDFIKDSGYRSVHFIASINGQHLVSWLHDKMSLNARVTCERWLRERDLRTDSSDVPKGFTEWFTRVSADDYACPAGLNDIKFEIQLRTRLSHAWSDVDHDIKYKHDIPDVVFEGFGGREGARDGVEIVNSLKYAGHSLRNTDRQFDQVRERFERLRVRYAGSLMARTLG